MDGKASKDVISIPARTFRVMKEKEIQRYGEYRTRRLALEGWERLKDIPSSSSNFQTEAAKESLPQAHLPPAPVGERDSSRITVMDDEEIIPETEPERQPQPSDPEPAIEENDTGYSIYRCQECGKLVLGFDREMHRQKSHPGRKVHFEAIKKKRG